MTSRWPASPKVLAGVFYVLNLVAIGASIASGYRKGDVAMRFQEKQSITFLSANQLAMTAVLAAAVYLVRRHVIGKRSASVFFWLLSSLGFLFLMLDEGFQFHEGMDSRVFEVIGAGDQNPRVDGLSTALYGVVALGVCWMFREEILRFRSTFVFFCVGGFFLAATSALNFGNAPAWQVALEESCKLLGVCSFLLGFLSAFLGSVAEARDLFAVPNPLPEPAPPRERSQVHAQ